MRQSTILKKMLIGISIPIIVVLGCSGILISSQVKATVTEQARAKLEADSTAVSNEVSDFFTQFLSGASHAASNYQFEAFIESTSDTTRLNQVKGYDEVKISLDKMAAVDTTNILATWVGDFDSSQITQSDGFNSDIGWDITKRQYYQVKDTKKPILTEPYIDASTGQLIVSAVAPILKTGTGEAVGAIGYDIKLSQLEASMKEYKIGQDGFIILCSTDGQVVYHPNSSYIQQNVSDLSWSDQLKQAFLSNFLGGIDYTMDGVECSGSMNEVGSCGWYVLTGMPVSEIMTTFYTSVKSILMIFGTGLVLLIGVICVISVGLSKPLKKLAKAADQIAAGNLDVVVDVKTSDEIGLVATAIERTVHKLKDYINYIDEISTVLNSISQNNLIFELKYDYAGDFAKIKVSMLLIQQNLVRTLEKITQTSNEVASGSEHVASGSQALSQGTTQQASSIEELSATISEISDRVKLNAAASKEADTLVKNVSGELVNGQKQMEELSSAMDDINQSSGEIGKIIKTIEDIAFQTNILALNAAVEAARAGSAGKGFAVVADEVRNLASKSAEAAKGTTALIEASIRSVSHGTVLTKETAATMFNVVGEAQKAADTIDQISKASERQAEAISQVSLGIEQISGVIQSNSATAEESAAASQELSSQARVLQSLVEQFQYE